MQCCCAQFNLNGTVRWCKALKYIHIIFFIFFYWIPPNGQRGSTYLKLFFEMPSLTVTGWKKIYFKYHKTPLQFVFFMIIFFKKNCILIFSIVL